MLTFNWLHIVTNTSNSGYVLTLAHSSAPRPPCTCHPGPEPANRSRNATNCTPQPRSPLNSTVPAMQLKLTSHHVIRNDVIICYSLISIDLLIATVNYVGVSIKGSFVFADVAIVQYLSISGYLL